MVRRACWACERKKRNRGSNSTGVSCCTFQTQPSTSSTASSPGTMSSLWTLCTQWGHGGSLIPCDFSKVVQLLKMLSPALPGTSLHPAHGPVSPLTSQGTVWPRFPPTQSHTGGGRQALCSAFQLQSIHWSTHSRPRCVKIKGKGKKGHCSKPFARISELKMEDLSFAWWREGARKHC